MAITELSLGAEGALSGVRSFFRRALGDDWEEHLVAAGAAPPEEASAEELAAARLRAVEAVTPAYNMMLFAAAPGMDLHFHVEIAPRREQALKAGLELATGISVVRQSPEDAAHAYRRWITEHDTAPRAATPTRPSPE